MVHMAGQCFGLMPMEQGSHVCIWKWQSMAEAFGWEKPMQDLPCAPCCLPTVWGEPKIGVVCFSSARKPNFAFQVDLKVLLIWMGLAMAFLVAGSIWRAADE